MSDVRYAFSDPCGMEMIIMVIIQHLNNPFSVRNTGKHICPGTWCWCLSATTNMSVLVRDIGGDREARRGKVMKRVRRLQSNWDKNLVEGEGVAAPRCPIPWFLSLSCCYPWLLFSIKELWLEMEEQVSVIFISQQGEDWLGPGFPLLLCFIPPLFCFPTTSCASFYALCIFWGQPCGLICMINFILVFIPIIRRTEHPPLPPPCPVPRLCSPMTGEMQCYGWPEVEWRWPPPSR